MRFDGVIIDDKSTLCGRMISPDKESNFSNKVERNSTDDIISRTLYDLEKGENDPIRQPECVVILTCGLDSFD